MRPFVSNSGNARKFLGESAQRVLRGHGTVYVSDLLFVSYLGSRYSTCYIHSLFRVLPVILVGVLNISVRIDRFPGIK